MSEPFSFSSHLTATFKSFRKDFGFKKKGTRFTKQLEHHVAEIYFQRSGWNLPGMPFEMYLNIGFLSLGGGRLNKPTDLSVPPHYLPFLSNDMSMEERNNSWDNFTNAELAAIKEYVESKEWKYSSEAQLVENLEIAKDLLSCYSEAIFEEAEKAIPAEADYKQCTRVFSSIIDSLNI